MDTQPVTRTGDAPVAVVIWDIPIRLFHWGLVLLVAVGWATAEDDAGWVFAVHRFSGYLIAALLLFRLAWGFLGSRRTRFADFVVGWPAVRRHLGEVVRFAARPRIGHTPLGGWMVLALLGALALVLLTGGFADSGESAAGPFAASIGRRAARAAAEIHEATFTVLLALVAVHVAGVLVESLLTRENLIRAMWTGRKTLAAADAAREPAPVHPLRAALIVAVAVAAVWLAVA